MNNYKYDILPNYDESVNIYNNRRSEMEGLVSAKTLIAPNFEGINMKTPYVQCDSIVEPKKFVPNLDFLSGGINVQRRMPIEKEARPTRTPLAVFTANPFSIDPYRSLFGENGAPWEKKERPIIPLYDINVVRGYLEKNERKSSGSLYGNGGEKESGYQNVGKHATASEEKPSWQRGLTDIFSPIGGHLFKGGGDTMIYPDWYKEMVSKYGDEWKQWKKENPNGSIGEFARMRKGKNRIERKPDNYHPIQRIGEVQDKTRVAMPFISQSTFPYPQTLNQTTPIQTTKKDVVIKSFEKDIHYLENESNKGMKITNIGDTLWYPYSSYEGGAPTVYDGLKLNEGTRARQIVDEQGYLTSQQAREETQKAYNKHYNNAKRIYNNYTKDENAWDELDERLQVILMDYSYNGVLHQFKNFMEGINNDDTDKIKANYKRYSKGKELTKRNKWTEDEFKNIYPDF